MIRAVESQVDVLWRRMVTIWKAQVHFFSGSSQIIKSFNRANNHKRLQLCALLKFFDNVIQSYFFFPVYKTFTTCTHDIAPKRVCTLTMGKTCNLQVQGIVVPSDAIFYTSYFTNFHRFCSAVSQNEAFVKTTCATS